MKGIFLIYCMKITCIIFEITWNSIYYGARLFPILCDLHAINYYDVFHLHLVPHFFNVPEMIDIIGIQDAGVS